MRRTRAGISTPRSRRTLARPRDLPPFALRRRGPFHHEDTKTTKDHEGVGAHAHGMGLVRLRRLSAPCGEAASPTRANPDDVRRPLGVLRGLRVFVVKAASPAPPTPQAGPRSGMTGAIEAIRCNRVPLRAGPALMQKAAPKDRFNRCNFGRNWSGRRDSNSRPQPWQGCALPLSYARVPRSGPGYRGAAPKIESGLMAEGLRVCKRPSRPLRRSVPALVTPEIWAPSDGACSHGPWGRPW